MPAIRTKKVTPEEQRIAKAIKEIQDGTLKMSLLLPNTTMCPTISFTTASMAGHH
jgi:hypothetical protein